MGDEQTAAFFAPADAEQPIILGAPEEYVGEIDAAPPAMVEEEPDIVVEAEAEEQEKSPMALWNDNWVVTLKERKDTENEMKASAIEKAQDDLVGFQAEREKIREAKMAKNRDDEQDKLDAIEADLESANSWQRVVKMVELTHDSSEGSLDCGRMRDIFISLKNDTDRAAILA
mmetsp:Transcript_9980/g.14125  ORF Transcript_9980/g.14125 Transcript_9980/m.14125 type:complete len:173 (-) Transcript_9980:486-1004(-)|eukprot:CAMPEP_0184862316 /NCGR_PEP_ID=MMETSP0580-20130426/6787_1 /TAXON_ID=1118495 /ORGANISM="Dactyliosolen fragilissimus" /LENGTH=172 /DNA_ID=CAMNT_0027360113 /DNA_START=73 /DNA_END=591 /DNA_ORIENTATION=-